jgi:hypothetical protein
MSKHTLCGLAAVFLAGTAVPAVAGPAPGAIDYVKVCGEYGDAFFYIPGTETCLAIGGYVRLDAMAGSTSKGYQNFNDSSLWTEVESAHEGPVIGSGRSFHNALTNTQASLSFDARTASEYGLVRSYAELHWSVGSATRAVEIEIEKAFVQFGGLTAGRSQSFFDFFTGFDDPVYFAPSVSNRQTNLLAYTFAFSREITATISIEDGTFRRATNGSDEYAAGHKVPDIVANVRIDQQWGMFQAMAAYHQDYGSQQSTAAGTGPWQKDGYAFGVGLMFRLPQLGKGDKLWLQAAWAKGAVDYTGADPYWQSDFADRSNTGLFQRTDWSLTGGFHHGFSKQYGVNLLASWHDSRGWVWRNTFTGANAIYGPKSADYTQLDLGASFDWTPADNFLVRVGGEYRRVEYATANNYFNRRPTNVARSSDDGLVGYVRVVRKFGGDDD